MIFNLYITVFISFLLDYAYILGKIIILPMLFEEILIK